MSHWGYVIEEIAHGHDTEEERRERRLRARAQRQAPRREGRWAAWMKADRRAAWAPKPATVSTDVPCARASTLSRLAP